MTEERNEPPGEQRRGIAQRVARSASHGLRRVTDPVTEATDLFTGRSLEEEVKEYSETFTTVALGLHEDLEAAKKKIEDLEREVTALTVSGSSQVSKPRWGSRLAHGTAWIIGAAAGIAVVEVIWRTLF